MSLKLELEGGWKGMIVGAETLRAVRNTSRVNPQKSTEAAVVFSALHYTL